jgi:uncharacterized membrane protein HdeD (DUF308 family)
MLEMLARNWWVLALRGLAAIIFGILALIWPELTILSLILVFGAYVLIDGIFAVITGIRSYGENRRWWASLLEGIAGIIVGILAFVWPDVTGLVLLYFIAAWAIVTGIFEIVAAIQLRRAITGEWLMILGGILSIVFGIVLVLFPEAGALGLIWVIGGYAIVFGLLFIFLAFRLRGMGRDMEREMQSAPRF